MGKDYYEVLGVSKDADEDQLKKGAGWLIAATATQVLF